MFFFISYIVSPIKVEYPILYRRRYRRSRSRVSQTYRSLLRYMYVRVYDTRITHISVPTKVYTCPHVTKGGYIEAGYKVIGLWPGGSFGTSGRIVRQFICHCRRRLVAPALSFFFFLRQTLSPLFTLLYPTYIGSNTQLRYYLVRCVII